MKICVTSRGRTMDAAVDPRFGRCKYFMLIDPDTLEFEALENSSVNAAGGAGIQAGQLMSERNIRALLTGNVGPNAFKTLEAAKIEVITGTGGTVMEAALKYKSGNYDVTTGATVEGHH